MRPVTFTKILLVGAPNSGKTSLFNWLTGSSLRSVNYAGATVELNTGLLLERYGAGKIEVLDTPGMVGWDFPSPEEAVTKTELKLNEPPKTLLIFVLDATQIARQTALWLRVAKLGFPSVVALTMSDLVQDVSFSEFALEEELGSPVVKIDGRLGGGIDQLFRRNAVVSSKFLNAPSDPESARAVAQGIEAKILGKAKLHLQPIHQQLDHLFLESALGPIIFFGVMTLLFTTVFWVAQPLMDGVDWGFRLLANGITDILGQGLIAQFLADGVVTGVGSVFTFVPQIVLVAAGLMVLEDSGYLARAATVVDRPLRALGLSGKSFVPLLTAHACAVPAALSARTISNRKERLLTLFMIPMMTCSARLPVYSLLIGFLLSGSSAWIQGLLMTGLYIFGFIAGGLVTLLISRNVKSDQESFFMMELPPYRLPQARQIFSQTLRKVISYLKNAGPVILILSLLIWGASTFPNYREQDTETRLKSSYLTRLGQAMDPVFAPMGQDWRVGVGILSAFAAREVFVSTVAIIFHASEDNEDLQEMKLQELMRNAVRSDGSPLFSIASVVSLILFFMIALQCLSTVGVVFRESGSLKFTIAQLVGLNLLAYVLSVILFQSLKLAGL